MKTFQSKLVVLAAALIIVACGDRSSEKKIAELEARLAQIEQGKPVQNRGTANPAGTATTPLTPVA